MIIAQISDTHIGRPGEKIAAMVDTAACLTRAVAQIGRLDPPPDALLITGDLVNGGTADEYAHLRELLAPLALPTYVIPGNHDDRAALRFAFTDHSYLPGQGFLHYTIDDLPLYLIALDTLVVGADAGALDQTQLDWLAARLSRTQGRPTLIMMHHPPFDTGIGFMDAMGLRDGRAEFIRLVSTYPQVERILCGHVHRAIEARVGGTLAMTCPSTCHQIALDLSGHGPAAFTLEPPGFRLHWWNGRQLVSHTASIGVFSGPYEFA